MDEDQISLNRYFNVDTLAAQGKNTHSWRQLSVLNGAAHRRGSMSGLLQDVKLATPLINIRVSKPPPTLDARPGLLKRNGESLPDLPKNDNQLKRTNSTGLEVVS